MRSYELSTPMPAPAADVWATLVDLARWGQWNKLVPVASGDVRPGQILAFKIRRVDGTYRDHTPTVDAIEPGRVIVLSATFGHRFAVKLVHTFTICQVQEGSCRLHQRWDASGVLVPTLWSSMTQTMGRFAELGEDLAARVKRDA
jgi:hypothetical protein